MRTVTIGDQVMTFDNLDSLNFADYRKKPVVIQACQIRNEFTVSTLEGEMKGNPGDYLIRGILGEYYPCKPDIFDATYEEVS